MELKIEIIPSILLKKFWISLIIHDIVPDESYVVLWFCIFHLVFVMTVINTSIMSIFLNWDLSSSLFHHLSTKWSILMLKKANLQGWADFILNERLKSNEGHSLFCITINWRGLTVTISNQIIWHMHVIADSSFWYWHPWEDYLYWIKDSDCWPESYHCRHRFDGRLPSKYMILIPTSQQLMIRMFYSFHFFSFLFFFSQNFYYTLAIFLLEKVTIESFMQMLGVLV